MSFNGEFRHTIDAKGRLIVPARMRDDLPGDEVWLTWWLEGCIAMWSAEGWAEIEGRLREQGQATKAARKVARKVHSSAHQDKVDRQGRISVPQRLRDEAGIERDCLVVGVGNHAEIWNPDRWTAQNEDLEEGGLEDLVEQLNF